MKRDLDLLRQLLQIIETAGAFDSTETYGLHASDRTVQYHLRLLVEAGLARGVGRTLDGAICVRLTWQGHELLELARNDVLWSRAKSVVSRQTGGLPLTALHALLTEWSVSAVADEQRWRVSGELRRGPLPLATKMNRLHTNGEDLASVLNSTPPRAKLLRPDPPLTRDFRDWGVQVHVLQGQHEDNLPVYLL